MADQILDGGVDGRRRFYRFLRFSHILSSILREILEEKYLRELKPHALTRAQFCFLKLIALNTELQVGEVARCVGVSAAASSKTIDKLERLGLVLRETSPDDRRAILLSASVKGQELVREYERQKACRFAPVIHGLGAQRGDQLNDLLEEVCLGLLEIGSAHGGPCLRCAGYYHKDCSVGHGQGNCALHLGRTDPSGRQSELEA